MKKIKVLIYIICVMLLLSFVSCKADISSSNPSTSHGEETTDEDIRDEILEDDAKYVASRKSDKYHLKSCRFVDNIKEENIVYYRYRSDAVSDGKKPCSECKP